MIEFKVVTSSRPDRFEQTITALLNEKWELHGSPFISQTGSLTQNLIRTVAQKSENKKVSK